VADSAGTVNRGTTGDKAVYRYRDDPLGCFFIRKGTTMYCIGVGKWKTMYDRDSSQISKRADDYPF